jgi:hypothetical protein
VTHEDMVESCCRVQTGPYEKTPTGKLHKTSNALLLLSTHQIAIACHTELLSEEIQARVSFCGQKFSGVRNICAQGYQDRAGLGPSHPDVIASRLMARTCSRTRDRWDDPYLRRCQVDIR